MPHYRHVVAVFLTCSIMPPASPELIECPNHAHVWNIQQCDNFDIDDSSNQGGGGDGRGFVGDLLHTLSGGLL